MCLRQCLTRCFILICPHRCFLGSLISSEPRNWSCQLQHYFSHKISLWLYIVGHLPFPTTTNPLQFLRGTVVVLCQLEVWYPDFFVSNAEKASFSHFSLASRVNSQFQDFRVVFPFHIYEIQYKFVLTFPALQVFLFGSYFSRSRSQQISVLGTIYGSCCWQLGGEWGVKQTEKGKKQPIGKRTLEAKRSCFGKSSCCQPWAFVFSVLNSVSSLFIQFCEPDPAFKLPDTCVSMLPVKAFVTQKWSRATRKHN